MIRFIQILVVFLLLGCSTKRNLSAEKTQDKKSELDLYDFKVYHKTFSMKIIDFIQSNAGCGVYVFCSNCLGVTEKNDTIRVLTQCPEFYPGGNSFVSGQNVLVTPDDTAKQIKCSVPFIYIGLKTGKISIKPPQNQRFITINGTLSPQ